MGSLIRFELKKICSQRVTQVAVLAIAALLAWVTTFNITSQFALDPNAVGSEFEGTSAIAQQKENADALTGPITNEAATDAIREWKTFMEGDEIAAQYQWGGSTMGTDAKAYWNFYAPRTNYLSLIQRALSESGFGQVPVISLTFGGQLGNEQPGFRVNWFKMLPTILNALLFSDCIAKLYYATIVREKEEGTAVRLKEKYLDIAKRLIENGSTDEWLATLRTAAAEFDAAACDRDVPRVGIVGEIFLKFNPFAQKNICEWLISRRIEVVPPLLTDFFVQGFVNYKVNQDTGLQKKVVPGSLIHWLYKLVWRRMEKFNRAGSRFRHFTPFANVFDESKEASRIISLSAQFGEGWLLPGEILSLARQRVDHVISLQPFGCIANHIVSKGIEKRIKDLYPQMHLLSLDFDSGVSDVNIMNRLLLFTNSLKTEETHASRTDRDIAAR